MPNLQPNTMTVIELEGDALAELREVIELGASLVRVMLEVEPDGSTAVKIKANEAVWSLPLEGATARVERLYDGEPAAGEPLPAPARWDSLVHLAGHLGHGCTLAADVLAAAGRGESETARAR